MMSMIGELVDRDCDGRLPHSRTGIVAFGLTTLGIVLGATVDMAFLLLAAAGMFGPNLLRELGLLRDRDERQQEAARRAAMHAYLVGGIFTMAVVIAHEWGGVDLDENAYPAVLVLMAFVVPYFLSYLTGFWGPERAAQRILLAFGLFWLVFNVLSHLEHPVAMVMQCLIAVPFFVLAALCRRWSRMVGVVLVGLACFVFFAFNMKDAFTGENEYALVIVLLFFLPLAYPGVALLARRPGEEAASER